MHKLKHILFNNINSKQTVFKNSFWLAVNTFAGKLLALALVIYAARILGAEGYGKFTFAVSFIVLLVVFSDFGLPQIITREFAREQGREDEFYSLLGLELLLILACAALIILGVFLTIGEKDVQRVILILSPFYLFNRFMGIYYSFFHARQKMEYEAWWGIFQSVLLLGFGLFVLFQFPSVENFSYAHSLAAFVALIFILIFFHWRVLPLKIRWNFSVWKKFLRLSWPLALMAIFGVVYNYTDSVMLGYWGELAQTGWYNAALRITMAGLIPMGFIGASFYPALSKFSKESKEKFQKAWDDELEIMILLALPLVVGGFSLAQKIIYAFYPFDFFRSIFALQILIFTVGIIFLYRPFYDAMIIFNQQTKTFWVTVGGAVVNVVLNFILIPTYSLYGAAFATLVTNVLVLLAIAVSMKNLTFIRFPVLRIFLTFLAASASSAVMYIAIKQTLLYNINIFILVILAAAAYFITFFGIKKYILAYVQK